MKRKIKTVITVTDYHEVSSVTIHRDNQDQVILRRNEQGKISAHREISTRRDNQNYDNQKPKATRVRGKKRSIDELKEIAREILMDENLEVSKVRPFFWSMVETYLDRFHQYPFDMVKAMICYLELRECPERQLQELMEQISGLYEKQYGKPMPAPVKPQQQMGDTIYDEIRELRETLKHAALVGERMDVE